MFGDLAGSYSVRPVRLTFQTDEGDTVGTGDSAEAHSVNLSGACGTVWNHGQVPGQSISTAARWSIVIVALSATLCSFVFINGIAFVIPMLETKRDTNLALAGLLSSMPSFGMVVTLVGWGALLDRIGERIVLFAGMALTALATFAAASMQSLAAVGAFLFLGGMSAASANTASGRLVTGWFPPQQRGLVMGIRQTAQPLGIALGAAVIPELAEHGLSRALMFPATLSAVAAMACAIGVSDPPRAPRSAAPEHELANPYRASRVLWRIHLVSSLLMVPQCVIATFMLVWLMGAHHWSTGSAGALVTASQLLGALGRVAAGRWSDRVAVRMRPIRTISAAGAAAMLVLAVADFRGWAFSEAAIVVAAVIAVLDNGLSSTAVVEIAGPYWSGRALGTQNTTQRLTAGVTPPLFGALIAAAGYPLAFAVCGLFPLVALPLVPVKSEPKGRPVGEALRTLHAPPKSPSVYPPVES
jgi:MFS family permease